MLSIWSSQVVALAVRVVVVLAAIAVQLAVNLAVEVRLLNHD
jgi:hypothetical protein